MTFQQEVDIWSGMYLTHYDTLMFDMDYVRNIRSVLLSVQTPLVEYRTIIRCSGRARYSFL